MGSAQSSHGFWCDCSRQPQILSRSGSGSLSARQHPAKAVVYKSDQCSGAAHECGAVSAFSRSVEEWVDGKFLKVMEGAYESTKYEAEEHYYGKTLDMQHSEHIAATAAVAYAPVSVVCPHVPQSAELPSGDRTFQGCRSSLPAECKGDPRKYYIDMDYIWTLLEQKRVLLIKGSWLLRRSRAVKFEPLPCRQDLPNDAVVDVAQLRQVVDRLATREIIVAISHCWLSSDHPDPDGKLIREIAPVIEAYLKHQNWFCQNEFGEEFEGAFFFAWCSMYQPYHIKGHDGQYQRLPKPQLTSEQQKAHQDALGNMDIWYTHSKTEVWMLTKFFAEQNLPYDERGWPTWERTVAELLTSSCALLDLGLLHSGQMNDAEIFDMEGVREKCRTSRRPPCVSKDFDEVIRHKHFTCGNIDCMQIKANYARNFIHAADCIREVAFQNMEWSCDQIIFLYKFLQCCKNLQDLRLSRNRIGDDGCYKLSEVLQCCGKLERLLLDRNHIGTAGVKHIVQELTLHSDTLKVLHLQRNNIGSVGAYALAELLPYCTKIEELSLEGNHISDVGTSALAEALQHCGNLKFLLIGENQIGDPGARSLAEGLMRCSNLKGLFLEGNAIGNDGAGALAKSLKHCSRLDMVFLYGNQIDDHGILLLAQALQHCHICHDATIESTLANTGDGISGFNLWSLTQPPAPWKFLTNAFWNTLSLQEQAVWQEREVAFLNASSSHEVFLEPSRFEFEYYKHYGNRRVHTVGLPTSWEAAKAKFNGKCQGPLEFDGDILPGMTVYETRGPGPKIFGVIGTDNIYYHDYGVWTKYRGAIPIPIS